MFVAHHLLLLAVQRQVLLLQNPLRIPQKLLLLQNFPQNQLAAQQAPPQWWPQTTHRRHRFVVAAEVVARTVEQAALL